MKLIKTLCFAAVTSAIASLSGTCVAQSQAAQAPLVTTMADSRLLTQAQEKIHSAQRIADRFVAEARRQGLDDNWRLSLLADLMRAPEEQFAFVENAQDLNHAIGAAAMIARNTTSAGAKSLGTATSDLTFVPINPCRILDTRQGSGTAFVGGDTKVYTFKNTNVGHGSCSVYSDYSGLALPAALAVNITVDESGLSGFPVGKFLAVFPDGGTLGSSFRNFGPGDILANAGIISINQSTGLFDVKSSAPAQVIIDVFGVFLAPLPTALDCVQTTAGNTSLGAGDSATVTSGTCTTGYTMTGGTCPSSPSGAVRTMTSFINYGTGNAAIDASSTFTCVIIADQGVPATAAARGVCCRVPGRN